MLLKVLNMFHSSFLRWALVFVATCIACAALASMMIGSAALRDHHTAVARLTPMGFINVCIMMPLALVTLLVNLVGVTGALFHNHVLLLIYSGATFVSLAIHFSADSLGILHLLRFEAHAVNASKSARLGPIQYEDTFENLHQLITESESSSRKYGKEIDEEDAELRVILLQYANGTDWLEPARSDQMEAADRKTVGWPAQLAAGRTAAGAGNISDGPGQVESELQPLVLANGTQVAAALPVNISINASTSAMLESVVLQLPAPSRTDRRLVDEERRVQSRLLIHYTELLVKKKLLEMGTLQRRFKCCGSGGYRDYLRRNMTVPTWCCRDAHCDRHATASISLQTEQLVADQVIYTEGCGAILHKLSRYVNGVLSVLEMSVVGGHGFAAISSFVLGSCCVPVQQTNSGKRANNDATGSGQASSEGNDDDDELFDGNP